MVKALSCALMVVSALTASRANADVSKAWASAKQVLPADTRAVLVIDAATATRTRAFSKLFDLVRREERDLREAYDRIKNSCGVDPLKAISGVVIAGDPSSRGPAAVAIFQLAVTRPAATACLRAVLRTEKGVTVADRGSYTVASKGSDHLYFSWLGPDVVAMAIEPDDKALLERWTRGKGAFAKSPVAALTAKLDPRLLATVAFASDKPLSGWVPIVKAFGTLALTRGNFDGTLTATLPDVQTARSMAADINQEKDREMRRDRTPAPVKQVLRAVSIRASGADLTIQGRVGETTLADAFLSSMVRKKEVKAPPARPAPPPRKP